MDTKWRAFTSALLALTLLVFTSSFANSSSVNMGNVLNPAYSDHVAETSPVSHSQGQSNKAMQMSDREYCCEDNEMPCADDKCDIPCMGFSVSHAVLSSSHGLLHGPGTIINDLEYSVKDGISGLLNAPPPRT